MTYFPNGSSLAFWQEENCADCLNHRDNGSGSFGCAITDAHAFLDYHEGTNAAVLDMLVPREGEHRCLLRLTREQLEADEQAAAHARDLARYQAAMAEMLKNPQRTAA